MAARSADTDRPKDIQERWASFRDGAFFVLHAFVALTLAYVLMIAAPQIKGGSPAIPDAPMVNFALIIIHVITAIPPLVLGLIAFNPALRRKNIGQHKLVGQVYCWSIWISAITGVILATANGSGIVGQLGFSTLGVLWFATTLLAYQTAKKRDIVSHRRWMIRSYALTLAVVTIRPLFLFGPFGGFSALEWVAVCSWLCWVPNIILGEIYLRITNFKGALLLPKRRRETLSTS